MTPEPGYWENEGDALTIEVSHIGPKPFVDVDLMSGHCYALLTAKQAREVAAYMLKMAELVEAEG